MHGDTVINCYCQQFVVVIDSGVLQDAHLKIFILLHCLGFSSFEVCAIFHIRKSVLPFLQCK